MKKILVPTDFSKNADNAMEYAVEMARKSDAKILLYSAFYVPSGSTGMLMSLRNELRRDTEEKMKRLEEKFTEKFGEEMLGAAIVSEGPPVEEIIENARDNQADLVVMGTQGSSGLEEIVMGSNAASVIAKADRPVLAVPDDTPIKLPEHIVYATNWMAENDLPFRKLMTLVRPLGAKLSVVHIVPPGKGQSRDFDARRDTLLQRMDYDNVDFVLRENDQVIDGILGFLEETNADVLTMLTRKRGFFGKLFDRSLTKKMAMHTRIPLLALHK